MCATAAYREITFSDEDVVNPGDFIAKGDYNPHNVRPFLLHDHGFALALVFADCLADAFDLAADAGKLDSFRVAEGDCKNYPEDSGLSFLGNGSEAFDVEGIDVVELPNPPFSFIAIFNAARKERSR